MEKIILVGTGPMAVDYSNVLQAMSKKFTVIGRGATSANVFKEKTGVAPITGGVENYLLNTKIEKHTNAIIATGTEALMPTMLQLLRAGVTRILIEKPAALSIEELIENEEEVKPFEDSIFVAYNRRFYGAVLETERLIEEDGGLESMHFEFTEWAHKIEPLQKAEGVKENWFFANSTHVVELAFFLAGKPKNWNCFSKSGELNWHPKTNFSGAGKTEKDVLFSYISNWESAGRWAIELFTKNKRIYLKPMEKVQVQLKGTIPVVEHEVDLSIDNEFKPGLYKQVDAFVNNNDEGRLLNLKEHMYNSKTIYATMLQ